MLKQHIMIKESQKTAIIVGEREVSYGDMLGRVTLFAKQTPQIRGSRTIILSENREGWIYALFSIWTNKGIAVPVDATSTASDIAYIISDCEPEAIWVSEDKLPLAKEALSQTKLKPQILLITKDLEDSVPSQDRAQISYAKEDTAVIIYTSGTTGSPKGVMLTFDNIDVNIHAVSVDVPIFQSGLCTMILLPLHHVLPLVGSLVAPLVTEGCVAISPSMSAADIMSTMQNGKVAILIGVPRLYSTLYKGIKDKIDANVVTRWLYRLAALIGSRTFSRLLFGSVRKKMGGAIRYFVSGGAALDKSVGEGLKVLGLDVLEGYGMTEAAPMICFTRPDDICPGVSGKPLPCCQVEIRDGEVCAKGDNIMKGYYNRPEETAEVLRDGWLYTGDLGEFDSKGRLVITGRKKEIIVLSNGKNVNPTELEYKLESYAAFVKEAGVIQDGDMLRAIIVPQHDFAEGLTETQVEADIRMNVLDIYNQSVANYKKIHSFSIYRGELPRTRLEKLQRYKLPALVLGKEAGKGDKPECEPQTDEYRILKTYIKEEKRCSVRPSDHIEYDLAFDSLDKVGLQVFIQTSFGMEITTDQLSKFATIADMADYVADYKTRVEVEKIDWKKILKEHTNIRLPDTWFTARIAVVVSKLIFKLYFKLAAKGVDNIPEGPCIIAPNHQSFLDGLFVMSFMKLRTIKNTYFYAKEQHIKRPFFKFLANHHHVIIMDMSDLKNSIQKMGEALKKEKNLIIFPEGTRTTSGKLGEFKKTFAILSAELGVPIVPVSIKGAFDAMPKGSILPRPRRVQVEFLAPIYPQSHSYEKLTDKVYNKIKMSQMGA